MPKTEMQPEKKILIRPNDDLRRGLGEIVTLSRRAYLIYSYSDSDEEVFPVPGYEFRSSKEAYKEMHRQQKFSDDNNLGIKVIFVWYKPEGK